ncbi:MAG: hypothetical protein GY809_21645, partial [Planctomycetes bacterium]|nr:hypothetical protein [Planctomycetota bacterium]
GCDGQTYYADPAESRTLTFPNTDVPKTMDAAEKILERMHFTISQMDTSTGRLVTNPLSGAQFFEFWRMDAANSKSMAESSLHTLRRSVSLEFSETGTGVSTQCHVLTERLNVPNREIAGHSRAYSMLTESSDIEPTMKLSQSQKDQMAWVPLGYDPDLAQSILFRIETELTEITPSQ